MKMTDRAYTIIDIKSIDDKARTIEGIASTPRPDRVGDIVESAGAVFNTPMPLLLDHNSTQQVGHVEFARTSKDKITFKARIAKVEEAGEVKDLVDKAWQLVKYKLRAAVSIGFRALDGGVEIMKDGGYRFTKWEWLELSLVSIPAQSDAVIFEAKSLDDAFAAIKSIDTSVRAASGIKDDEGRPVTPGASGKSKKPVKAQEPNKMKKTIAEQISAFLATRESKSAEMDTIMDVSAEKGETLDLDQKETYDTLAGEVKAIDDHLVRLREREKTIIATAKAAAGGDPDEAGRSRVPALASVQVKRNVEKGIIFTRVLGAKYLAFKHNVSPMEVAKSKFGDTPEVELILRAPIAAMNTSDSASAGPLVDLQNYTGEFIDLLRPQTIIGRIPGLRRVPFNIKMSRGLTDPTAYWVGEGKVKPVSSQTFDTVTLGFAKVAGIVPQTEELMRFSNPSSEVLVRDGLIAAIAYLTDRDFLDPTKAATDISPASITNGVTPITSTGTTADSLRADLGSLLDAYEDGNMGDDSLVLVMTRKLAGRIALMRNTLGNADFPGIGREGGSLEGIPVVTSNNIVAANGSPVDGSLIVAINASSVLLADDGGVDIDISREASLQMDSSPDSPATGSTTLVSLWQHNMVAIRAERFINWKKARATAVQYINGARYA